MFIVKYFFLNEQELTCHFRAAFSRPWTDLLRSALLGHTCSSMEQFYFLRRKRAVWVPCLPTFVLVPCLRGTPQRDPCPFSFIHLPSNFKCNPEFLGLFQTCLRTEEHLGVSDEPAVTSWRPAASFNQNPFIFLLIKVMFVLKHSYQTAHPVARLIKKT